MITCELFVKKKNDNDSGKIPGCTFVTPSPTLSTIPPPSWPNITGNRPSGSWPLRVYASVWQTALKRIFILTSWAFGGATSIVSIFRSSLAAHATTALHVIG